MFLEIGHTGPFYKSGELMTKCKKWPSGKSGQVQLWLTLLSCQVNEWQNVMSGQVNTQQSG